MSALTRPSVSCCLTLLIACNLVASDLDKPRKSLTEIRAIRLSMQKRTASLLVLTKQLHGAPTKVESKVKVVKPAATIREADLIASEALLVAQLGDEFPFLKLQGDWYQVKLADGREGWIREDAIQPLTTEETAQSVSPDASVNRGNTARIADELFEQIMAQHDTVSQLIAGFETYYRNLAEKNKKNIQFLYDAVQREREKIRLSHAYARHFYQELAPAPIKTPIGFEGVLSARFGKSAFESAAEESETARNLSFVGSMILSPRSRITANVNHSNEVVQTAYTSNDVKIGHIFQTRRGTRIRSFVSYRGYDDKNLDRNNFKDLGAGLNVDHPLGATTRFFGNFQANSKSYDEEGSNDYKGGQFDTGLQFGRQTQLNLGVRGRVQSSDISFLDYQRFIPNLKFLRRTKTGSFGINAELEQITYDTDAESNDFNRERVDLVWSGRGNQKQLSVIAKQFPNNEDFDNVKFLARNQWSKSAGGNYGRTAISALYVHHPKGGDALTNYLDLRLDRNRSGQSGYFDLSFFSRLWQDKDRDHSVDAYSRFGWKISRIQIGPVAGAHLMLNTDDFEVKRDGNSFRIGLDSRGHFLIKQTTIYSSLRYQRSFVFGSEISIDSQTGLITEGEIQTRNPTTLEFSAGLRTPISRVLDLQIDVRHYNIDLDVSREVSINPINERSSLRFLAGVIYRVSR